MSNNPNLDYFESDQVRLAVALWKAAKRANEPDFDVLRFGREWPYADSVLLLCLGSANEAVSDAAMALMQLRSCLEQQRPEQARKIGAKAVAASGTEAGAERSPQQRAPSPPAAAVDDSPLPPRRYTKSLR